MPDQLIRDRALDGAQYLEVTSEHPGAAVVKASLSSRMRPAQPANRCPIPFTKTLEEIAGGYRHDARDVFQSFCRLAACALAAATREKEYLAEIKERGWTREELGKFSQALAALVIDMEQTPYSDLLGPAYMEFGGNRPNGEFYTPMCVSHLMAKMIFSKPIPPTRITTLAEPACGSGGMILAAAQACGRPSHLRVTATDISRVACDMTFINTTLWHIPTEIIHGNTLSLEVWGYWKNLALRLQEQGLGQATGDGSWEEAKARLKAIIQSGSKTPAKNQSKKKT